MEKVEKTSHSETQRMELRGLVRLSSEIIAHYWPMRTFVHHNLLHGLEYLPFGEALRRGHHFLGGKGYLSNETFREYFRSGRILSHHIDAALRPLAHDKHVTLGNQQVTHFEVLRAHLLAGIFTPSEETVEALMNRDPDQPLLEALVQRLSAVPNPPDDRERIEAAVHEDQAALGRCFTLAAWCDRALGTQITDQINGELIKWCEAFLDEGHAPWPMPDREKGFYGAWKFLAGQEWFPCGIRDSRQKLARLPAYPEDALLENLAALNIPSEALSDYLSLHLAALPGWAGFIKWRADQTEYEWQQAYPADLVQYLAVRLWYERELVQKACREELGTDGNFGAISIYMQRHPHACFFRRERVAGRLPVKYAEQADRLRHGGTSRQMNGWEALAEGYAAEFGPRQDRTARLSSAWRLLASAKALEIAPAVLMETPPENFRVLLDWLDAFPESEHGPVWLRAFEASYHEQLIAKLRLNLMALLESEDRALPVRARGVGGTCLPAGRSEDSPEADRTGPHIATIRPQAQGVFCIDVRSEPFRRHLEAIGDYETFGFAGFFIVFIRYQAFGNHHETDQFPVIMTAKNRVREIPRTYQGLFLSEHRARTQLVHAGHTLLHDLKENVVTPYVMVESLGWFYSLPFIARTVFSSGYRNITAWFRRRWVPPIATTLTVDKLPKAEVEEMMAAEQRAIIRRALRERFGDRDLNLSLDRLEFLRRRALDEPGAGQHPTKGSLSAEEETAFIVELRCHYRINQGWAFARMERITRMGFTLNEQLFTVETALRMMGLTQNFARLVLLCGHGSTSENNPFEAALDCGACGGNVGKPNARLLAAMANKPQVREALAKNGILIPQDTYFIAGQHDTTTDEVHLFDLEDLPPTHRKDLLRLIHDLKKAGLQNSQERCSRFPEATIPQTPHVAARSVRQRSCDWSQVRPEWGLSGNAAFMIGRRDLTRGINLEGRVFLHSYDYREDPTGRLLEILMTAPQVVAQWINMEHYFSTVDNDVYGSGSKIYHNVVGRVGIMYGTQSDLRIGLAWQTVMDGQRPYHEPMRLLTLIESPRDQISLIIQRHHLLQHFYDNVWTHLVAIDPEEGTFYRYIPNGGWMPLRDERPLP